MKLNNLKKTVLTSVFGLAVLVGSGEFANAQTNKQIRKQRQKVERLENKTARQEQKLQNMRYRVNRNGSYYQTDSRGAELLRQAVNRGYQQGVRAGQNDRNGRRRGGYNNNSVYQNGNYGYQSYVDSRQYQYYFQQGFERGYQDGYNSRYQNGTNNNGTFNILGTILQGILNIQQY
jgi:flagellar biosynthesis/type III secretory pathway protein FliH